MEERVLIDRAIVKDIANAVREKSESSAKFQVSQLGDAIRAIGGTGSAVTELAEAIAGPIAKDDISLANALAAGLTDAPAEQSWNGERRTAGGGSIKDGVAFVDKIKGNSLKMVQLITNGDFSSGLSHWVKYSGATAINAPNVENGKLVVNCIADTSGVDAVSVVHNMTNSYITGHIYLILLSFESSNSNLQPMIEGPTSGSYLSRVKGSIWGLRVTSAKSVSRSYFKTGTAKRSGDTWSFDNVMVFDLTAMFGSGNEPATADEFIQRLGYASVDELPYIPYTEGEIVSMRASEIVSRGRNLWDEEWEMGDIDASNGANDNGVSTRWRTKNYIELPSNSVFYISAPSSFMIRGRFYDKDKNYLGYNTIDGRQVKTNTLYTAPAGACYFRFAPNNADFEPPYTMGICVAHSELPYAPYQNPASLPLGTSEILDADGNQLFPDGLRGIGDVRDEIDLARGKAIKRIDAVDLGTLSWIYNAPYFQSSISSANPAYPTELNHCLCMKYSASNGGTWDSILDKMLGIYGVNLRVKDSDYTDATAFKASLAGQLLYYELAEPIEVDINPAKAWYRAENGGREELVSDGWSAPLTADIAYRGISAEEFINEITE